MGVGRYAACTAAVFLLMSVPILFIFPENADARGYNPDITVGFDDNWMEQELAPDHIVNSPLPIHWYAKYGTSRDLQIDLFIKPEFGGEWLLIAEGIDNSGTHIWDMVYPTVPDGDYILKVIAWTPDLDYCDAESQFAFHVVNLKPPDVVLTTFNNGTEISGTFELTWNVLDEDTPRYLIHSDVYISSDSGDTYDHLQGFIEDPGMFTIDTSNYPNGDHYRFKVSVQDPDGMEDSDVSDDLFFFNNAPPEVSFSSPSPEEGIFGKYRIQWDSDDIDEPPENLMVDLWYETLHEGGRTDLLRRAQNRGYYIWDTSEARPGPHGHVIYIQLTDSRGMVSSTASVKTWVLSEGDDIFREITYPRGTVKDNITIEWTTYRPANEVSDNLRIWAYHRAPGSEWKLITAGVEDNGVYSLDVRNGTDGVHGLKVVIMDTDLSWVHDEVEVQVEVYHEMEPQMFIREPPENGSNVTSIMEFEVAGYDGNGDRLTYMGLYSANMGGWQVFDLKEGNYKQFLVWNTTGLEPGEYRVRIAVYDGSRYNLSTSRTFGPYILEDNVPPPSHPPIDRDSDRGLPPMVWALIVLVMLVFLVGGTLLYMIRKDRKRLTPRDIDGLRMGPRYVKVMTQGDKDTTLFNMLLPGKGGSSGNWVVEPAPNGPLGLDEEERARIEGYLDMFDPDLEDDVTPDDIKSYEVLGVGRNATPVEIRAAYMGFVKRYHPDKLARKDKQFIITAESELRRKNRSRAILMDPQKRALVDRMLRENEAERIRESSVRSIDEIRSLGRK